MVKIDNVKTLTQTNFIEPIEINYTLKGEQKVWEAIISHDSVAILLWHTHKKAFVLVKQLRATVLHTHQKNGYTYELCAGILDKELSEKEIAKEEIEEECGYSVPLEHIERITSFYPSVGVTGAKQTLFFACIDDTMKINDGGGLADEDIEVIYLPHKQAREFMFNEEYHKTPGMMMAFYWFFENKKELL